MNAPRRWLVHLPCYIYLPSASFSLLARFQSNLATKSPCPVLHFSFLFLFKWISNLDPSAINLDLKLLTWGLLLALAFLYFLVNDSKSIHDNKSVFRVSSSWDERSPSCQFVRGYFRLIYLVFWELLIGFLPASPFFCKLVGNHTWLKGNALCFCNPLYSNYSPLWWNSKSTIQQVFEVCRYEYEV